MQVGVTTDPSMTTAAGGGFLSLDLGNNACFGFFLPLWPGFLAPHLLAYVTDFLGGEGHCVFIMVGW